MLNDFFNFATKKDDGYLIKAKIIANSKQNSIEFCENDDYNVKLKISKPAVEGRANEEIVKYLSKTLNLPKNSISIVKGEKSTIKTLFVKKVK